MISVPPCGMLLTMEAAGEQKRGQTRAKLNGCSQKLHDPLQLLATVWVCKYSPLTVPLTEVVARAQGLVAAVLAPVLWRAVELDRAHSAGSLAHAHLHTKNTGVAHT